MNDSVNNHVFSFIYILFLEVKINKGKEGVVIHLMSKIINISFQFGKEFTRIEYTTYIAENRAQKIWGSCYESESSRRRNQRVFLHSNFLFPFSGSIDMKTVW